MLKNIIIFLSCLSTLVSKNPHNNRFKMEIQYARVAIHYKKTLTFYLLISVRMRSIRGGALAMSDCGLVHL